MRTDYVGSKKNVQLRTEGVPSIRASVSAIWVRRHWIPWSISSLRSMWKSRRPCFDDLARREMTMGMFPIPCHCVCSSSSCTRNTNEVKVRGLVSKFAVGCGRNGTDRQFFFVNGRPCAPSKASRLPRFLQSDSDNIVIHRCRRHLTRSIDHSMPHSLHSSLRTSSFLPVSRNNMCPIVWFLT